MFIDRSFFATLLVFIEVFLIVKGNDELDKKAAKMLARDLAIEINEITIDTRETLSFLHYVRDNWQDIHYYDQTEIWHLHQQVINYAKSYLQPLTAQIILQHKKTFLSHVSKLRNYMKNVIYYHSVARRLQAEAVGAQHQRVTLEFQTLMKTTEQLIQKYDRLKLCWGDIPDNVKMTVRQGIARVHMVMQQISPYTEEHYLTPLEMVSNRGSLLQSVSQLNDYVHKVLEMHNQQSLSGPKAIQEAKGQGLVRQGQKRPNEQELNRQGDKRKPPGLRKY